MYAYTYIYIYIYENVDADILAKRSYIRANDKMLHTSTDTNAITNVSVILYQHKLQDCI